MMPISTPQTGDKARDKQDIAALRKEAGAWLRAKRESAGLSQRDLATKVGIDYYTFISQIEAGRGKVPAERYESYAVALNVSARDFAITMLRFNDPHTYALIFDADGIVLEGGAHDSTDLDAADTDPKEAMRAMHDRLRKLEAKLGL